jgi:hypothetical protein
VILGLEMSRAELNSGSARLDSIKISSVLNSTRVRNEIFYQLKFESVQAREQLGSVHYHPYVIQIKISKYLFKTTSN